MSGRPGDRQLELAAKMMLERILRGVAARLTDGEGTIRRTKVVCLDDSQGPRQGFLLLLFADDGDAPQLIAKGAPLHAARRREGRSVYEIEYENLERLQRIGMNDAAPTTPEPLGMWRDGELLVTLQSALRGQLLKNVPGRTLYGPRDLETTLQPIFECWRNLQQRFGVQREQIGESYYAAEVLEPVEEFRQRFVLEQDESDFLNQRFVERRCLLGLELPLMAEHGDFCPANLVRQGKAIGVFDWEFPLRHRLPLFDLFHFFASSRFPFRGHRGESSHFESFVEVYWGDNYFQRSAQSRLLAVCEEYAIPRETLADLFVLSLIRIANLKYQALVEIYGTADREPAGATGHESLWERAGGQTKDVPFAHIRQGVFENLRLVVRRGLPAFLGE